MAWQYLFLFLSAFLGGAAALLGAGRFRAYLPSLLSFSGAYLLGIAALELLPETFGAVEGAGVGLWLLLGFFIQLLLEGLSQGVEHGHVHADRPGDYGFAVRVMLGLGLHAFIEGLPLGVGDEHLLVGIGLHKLPAAFALGLLLRSSAYTLNFSWVCLLIFAVLSPLGGVVGQIVSIDPVWRLRILAVVVGSLLHISTTILFESEGDHRHGVPLHKLVTIVVGMGVAYFTAH